MLCPTIVWKWCNGFDEPPKVTYLVHGEEDSLQAQAEVLKGRGWNVKIPKYGEEFDLG